MRKVFLPLALLVLLTSCRFFGGERIRGNGNIVTDQRNVGSFNAIEASGAIEVRIKQDAASSVRIETDENLQEYIDVFTDGNTLVIEPRKGYNPDPSRKIIVYATAPSFRAVDISGASGLFTEGTITGPELELQASGASEMRLDVKLERLQADLSGNSTLEVRGSSNNFSIEGSGSSTIKCLALTTEEATLDVSGSTDAEITVNKQLNVDASGSSNISYRGNPNVNQNSSGASNVRKIS